MGLVWTIPVVAAAIAAGVVAARARALEDAGRQLTREVARLSELRWSLAALRASVNETDARVAAFRERHAAPPDGNADGDGRADGG